MESLNKEYIELLSGAGNPSEKFWELEKRLKVDKKRPGVLLQMKRSDLIFNVISLINDDVIELADLDEFSNELKEKVSLILDRQNI